MVGGGSKLGEKKKRFERTAGETGKPRVSLDVAGLRFAVCVDIATHIQKFEFL